MCDFEIKDGVLRKYTGSETVVNVPDGIAKIGAGAFKNSGVTEVTLPEGLITIGDDAFYRCKDLKTVNIPGSVRYIEFQAFSGCGSLESVTLPESIELIASYAFMNCKCLKEIVIPGNNCSICDDAFRASGIKKISFLEGTREVGNRICYGCTELETVILPESLETIGNGSFTNCSNLTNINILERIREIATIKVLGFRKRETSEYVFRENIVLTTIGMAIGIGLGVLLHSFVIDQIAVDLVYFRKQITLLSFVLSVLLTYVFTFLVDRVMSIKLEKINMAESLKSVE